MAGRPSTARSEISSAISEDGYGSRPQSSAPLPALPNPSALQHGYDHLRGITQPTNRSVRSTPSSAAPTAPIAPAAPSSTTGSSRPQSPASQGSRTHVPSLTAQGFFKPMSSQRLQAQRMRRPLGTRTMQTPAPIPDQEVEEDAKSVASSRQGPVHAMPRSHRPTPSIATDYTHSEAPDTADAAVSPQFDFHPEPDTQLVNGGNPQKPQRLSRLNIATALKAGEPPQKSPLSFGSGLSLGSKHRLEHGHQPLSSNVTSPAFPPANADAAKNSSLGRNHEYFEGNTVFWLGGRLQNARDRPINIATGIFLVLPAVLFFVYS